MKNILFSLVLILLSACSVANDTKVNEDIHIFYYNWYGNPTYDKHYYHWAHDILPHWSDTTWNRAGKFQGGEDIGANFYPELGCYSSNDTSIIQKHFEMIRQAGVGSVAITWWGSNSYEDLSMPLYLNIAERYGLKLIFHIEPFYRSAEEFKTQLNYLSETYGSHPALYRREGKPLYYVYDSYKIKAEEWEKLLLPEGALSLRNTPSDAFFIGLWVEENEQQFFLQTGFDGFYTYFASDGFVYGSSVENWNTLAEFARQNKLLFIPCAGPGYIDTRIRPWNGSHTKERENGAYYEKMFAAATKTNPDYIGITSFNEWHEGTQIEPAVPKRIDNFTYDDYGTNDPWYYIRQTKKMILNYKNEKKQPKNCRN